MALKKYFYIINKIKENMYRLKYDLQFPKT